MSKSLREALHDVHTATNDVLEGYATMLGRAEPEIVGIVGDLKAMHERHAEAQRELLARMGQDDEEDTSLRGTMNTVAVTVRDWITGLDEGSLSAVERGETALGDIYTDAIEDLTETRDPAVRDLLDSQRAEIGTRIEGLGREVDRAKA